MNTPEIKAEEARQERPQVKREDLYQEARRCVSWAIQRGLMSKPRVRRNSESKDTLK